LTHNGTEGKRSAKLDCARRGARHPNLSVASIAYRWAATAAPADEPPGDVRKRYLAPLFVGVVIDAIAERLIGAAPGLATGSSIGAVTKERREAKRIMRTGPPPVL
jgi:hypothetical protein